MVISAYQRLTRRPWLIAFAALTLFGVNSLQAELLQPEQVAARPAAPTAEDLGLPPGLVLYTLPEIHEPDLVWLSDLAGGRFFSAAVAANDNTWITGYGTDADGFKAVVWRPLEGGRWELIPLPSPSPAQAFGINSAGSVVGTVQQRPAIWSYDEAKDAWNLQLLEGQGRATSIDAEGGVIQGQLLHDGSWTPTRWTLTDGNWVATPIEQPKKTSPDTNQQPNSNFFVTDVTATGITVGFALKVNCLPLEGADGNEVVACDEIQEAFLRLPGGGGGVPAFAGGTPTTTPQAGLPPLGGLANSGFPAAFGGGYGGGGGGSGGGDDDNGGNGGGDGEPIPEPATIVAWLLLTAVFGLAALWRRRRALPV